MVKKKYHFKYLHFTYKKILLLVEPRPDLVYVYSLN